MGDYRRLGLHTIREAYTAFRKRPSMFMGKKSFSLFVAFLHGVLTLEATNECYDNERMFPAYGGEFESWLAKKYGHRSGKSFALALEKSDQDDEKAFDLWFEWYDKFQEKQEKEKKQKAAKELRCDVTGDLCGTNPEREQICSCGKCHEWQLRN